MQALEEIRAGLPKIKQNGNFPQIIAILIKEQKLLLKKENIERLQNFKLVAHKFQCI